MDIEPVELGRNYPLKAGVQADVKVAVTRMLAQTNAESAGRRKAWVEQAAATVKEWRGEFNALLTSDAVPMRPERICKELSDHLPDYALVGADTRPTGMLHAQSRVGNECGSPGRSRWA